MSRSDTDPDPIPCDASAELDFRTNPDRPLRVDVEVPAGFDPADVRDAVRLAVRRTDE